MCGICGVIHIGRSGPVDRDIVDRMTMSMRHRGPDGHGTWLSSDRRVGLGHRRLAIVDLSDAGRQPMAGRDASVLVTFNGEIYNFRELRAELRANGYAFRSQTDTEVLVYLYEELGDAMVDRLDGDFAFAIWDGRRRRLLLARDRAGVKPLYYAHRGDRFIFASEIKGLLRHPLVRAEVDQESLYHYLTYLVVPPPATLFKGIRKLPAGGMMTVCPEQDELRIHARQYWSPLPGQSDLSMDALDEQFEDLFERAVSKRLMGDVPVGVLFSGGVDSTLNAASFAHKVRPRNVRTYTVGVRGTRLFRDESAFASQVAQRLGTQHHEVAITESDLLAVTDQIAAQQDEPLADPVCVPLYFVTRLARQTGTTVLHAGEGADEIFCGYDKYRRFLNYQRRLWQPLSRMPSLARLGALAVLRRSGSSRGRKMADALRRMGKGQRLFLSSSVGYYESEKAEVLSTDFRRRQAGLDSYDVAAELYRELERDCPGATLLQQMSFIELKLRLPELLLMRVDKMSMLNSVEVRVPFLDRDLVDFALSVPESFKLRDGINKEPVKRLAARYVPREWIYRPKTGFGAPIQEWFAAGLGRQMQAQLHEDATELAEFFDVPALHERLRHPPPTVNDAFQLWVVYNFIQWRRSFFVDAVPRAA